MVMGTDDSLRIILRKDLESQLLLDYYNSSLDQVNAGYYYYRCRCCFEDAAIVIFVVTLNFI